MATVEPYETKQGGRYQVRYRKPDRTQTKKRGFRTKRDAELFLASVEVSKARGEFIDATAARALIGPLGEVWLARQTHLKPPSYRPDGGFMCCLRGVMSRWLTCGKRRCSNGCLK